MHRVRSDPLTLQHVLWQFAHLCLCLPGPGITCHHVLTGNRQGTIARGAHVGSAYLSTSGIQKLLGFKLGNDAYVVRRQYLADEMIVFAQQV